MKRLKDKVGFLELRVKQLSETAHEALAQVEWLTSILVEANIIQDIDTSKQRLRKVNGYVDVWGNEYKKDQAFIVNSIKPKAKK